MISCDLRGWVDVVTIFKQMIQANEDLGFACNFL